MYLKSLELTGFKSFAKKGEFVFSSPISSIVGPNGSGKSNVAEAFRFVLGEQSLKSMRGKKGEDLIWGGSDQVPRAGRASVKVVFDNLPASRGQAGSLTKGKRLFDIDFDDVVIERVVHRDGVNQYHLNGSQVRLRDVAELLASANIGSSGHHIISQGEADRILRASPKERREMVEDALGLRAFQYKLRESERKLEHTKSNIEQVQALRREIAPHLKFLKRQVEKIEKTLSLRDELKERYQEYLKREDVYLEHTKQELARLRSEPEERLKVLERELEVAKQALEQFDEKAGSGSEADELDGKLQHVRAERDKLSRELGRLEGQIAYEERASGGRSTEGDITVRLEELRALSEEIDSYVRESQSAADISLLRELVGKIQNLFRSFIAKKEEQRGEQESQGVNLAALREKQQEIERRSTELGQEEEKVRARYEALRREALEAKDESREAERRVFTIREEQQALRGTLSDIAHKEDQLARLTEAFERELQEGSALVGAEIMSYKRFELREQDVLSEDRERQLERNRAIEKIKLRLEEAGSGSGEEVMKEYDDVKTRDEFLEHEIEDLEKSAATLRGVIVDLEKTLTSRFKEGIDKINTEFQNFFSLMFGGGNASLAVVKIERRRSVSDTDLDVLGEDGDGEVMEEKDEAEEGIEVKVSLPRKKIRGLEMLSGGERALTSIALLFAMSQVNPPPFLVLDETDAALDEANSKRYGDMIETLSRHSQLILITHNRETMSRAGVLYGVTMGRDGVSKLLSVQFDEAVAVAK